MNFLIIVKWEQPYNSKDAQWNTMHTMFIQEKQHVGIQQNEGLRLSS